MIEAVKKRYKIGDLVTIHTLEASFTGVLDAFEETCVILTTDEGDEFILNVDIKRVSVPKNSDLISIETPLMKKQTKPENENEESQKDESKPEPTEINLLSPQYKAGEKIPLEVLETRINKKVKPPNAKNNSTITLKSLSELSNLNSTEFQTSKPFYLNYSKATRSKNIDKNFHEALRFYMLALENNEKKIAV